METKFTKGEWKIRYESTGIYHERIHIHCNGFEIAEVIGFGQYGEPQQKANAKLIAAAPCMLEVLETIENDNNGIPEWLWIRIKEAIKKATE